MKYHYPYRFFTYSLKQDVSSDSPSSTKAFGLTWDEDIVRWGVWLGRHIC
jgi:hypothetical protein